MKHKIRVVFRDQAMQARTLFRGAKPSKIGKKGCAFAHAHKPWEKKKDGRKLSKNHEKNAYLGCISCLENTCLGCVLTVLLGR